MSDFDIDAAQEQDVGQVLHRAAPDHRQDAQLLARVEHGGEVGGDADIGARDAARNHPDQARRGAEGGGGERVALLAGGGLSHWLGVPQEGQVNEAWDRWFMEVLAQGRGCGLAKLTNEQILSDAGNGGLEVNAWIAVAGAVSTATGECLFYEAIPAWASGMAGMSFEVTTD